MLALFVVSGFSITASLSGTSSSFDIRSTRLAGARASRGIDLTMVKDEARNSLEPGNLAREMIMALPDQLDEGEFDALIPVLVRVLRARSLGVGYRP